MAKSHTQPLCNFFFPLQTSTDPSATEVFFFFPVLLEAAAEHPVGASPLPPPSLPLAFPPLPPWQGPVA